MYFIISALASLVWFDSCNDALTHFSVFPKSFQSVHYRNSLRACSLNLENHIAQVYFDIHGCNIDFLCLNAQSVLWLVLIVNSHI